MLAVGEQGLLQTCCHLCTVYIIMVCRERERCPVHTHVLSTFTNGRKTEDVNQRAVCHGAIFKAFKDRQSCSWLVCLKGCAMTGRPVR